MLEAARDGVHVCVRSPKAPELPGNEIQGVVITLTGNYHPVITTLVVPRGGNGSWGLSIVLSIVDVDPLPPPPMVIDSRGVVITGNYR